jgi:hypothetical protein
VKRPAELKTELITQRSWAVSLVAPVLRRPQRLVLLSRHAGPSGSQNARKGFCYPAFASSFGNPAFTPAPLPDFGGELLLSRATVETDGWQFCARIVPPLRLAAAQAGNFNLSWNDYLEHRRLLVAREYLA